MNILMLTNTFTPHVGGVARSVTAFRDEFQSQGHPVLVVAPSYDQNPEYETGVVRVPTWQRFNGTDFSVPVPLPGMLHGAIEQFRPQIVHSHHPFLLGDTALRIAATWNIPVVFTHHTRYEQYTHYVPGNSAAMKRFVIDLVAGYCNLCDAVVAPSKSIADILRRRGVNRPVEVIPTGVDLQRFAAGNRTEFRRSQGIPADAFVVGYVGRLAREKNLAFLGASVGAFLSKHPHAWFVVAGTGPAELELTSTLAKQQSSGRVVMMGVVPPEQLPHVYRAMDVFAFASQSETQGMVLTEAMAAGLPVVAVDAPGVREVVEDRHNGRLLSREDLAEFSAALAWIDSLSAAELQAARQAALATADKFSMTRSAQKTLALYQRVRGSGRVFPSARHSTWDMTMRRIEEEWKIWANVASAVGEALIRSDGNSGNHP